MRAMALVAAADWAAAMVYSASPARELGGGWVPRVGRWGPEHLEVQTLAGWKHCVAA